MIVAFNAGVHRTTHRGATRCGLHLDFDAMNRRRVIAALLSLLLSHLMVAGDLSACVDAAGHSPSDADATALVANDHAGSSHGGAHPAPSDAPVPSQCCAAMMSCAVTLIAASPTERMDPAAEAGRARDIQQRSPASRVRAPDPPPPKASSSHSR